jgi:hypothetical protein
VQTIKNIRMFVALIAIQITRMGRSSLHKVAESKRTGKLNWILRKRLSRLDGSDLAPVEPLPVNRG